MGWALYIKGNFEARNALLSQEGSEARQGRASGGSQANLVIMRLWNLPSHDLDFVSIILPS